MGLFKGWHIVVLLIVLILLFGANKLPEIARNVGKSAKVLKKEMKELTEDESKNRPPAESIPVPPAGENVVHSETVVTTQTVETTVEPPKN